MRYVILSAASSPVLSGTAVACGSCSGPKEQQKVLAAKRPRPPASQRPGSGRLVTGVREGSSLNLTLQILFFQAKNEFEYKGSGKPTSILKPHNTQAAIKIGTVGEA